MLICKLEPAPVSRFKCLGDRSTREDYRLGDLIHENMDMLAACLPEKDLTCYIKHTFSAAYAEALFPLIRQNCCQNKIP